MYFNLYDNKHLIINGIQPTQRGDAQRPIKDEPVDETILIIAQDINTFENLMKANEYFDSLVKQNPQFRYLDHNVYQYRDYFINTGKKFNILPHANGLKTVMSIGPSCAPMLIAFADCKNSDDCTLITQIEGSEDNAPVPYEVVSSIVPVEAKQKLIEDVDLLSANEIANTNMLDKNNWHFLQGKDIIIISDWSDLADFSSDKAKAAFKKRIGDLCGLIY